jgi:hypothetical protein
MPGDGLTHGPPATKNAGGSHHRFSRINRHSPRDGLRLIRALPGVPGFLATIAGGSSSASLIPASGNQDHAISPSAWAASSTAPIRPSHPAPNVRDDREAPLWIERRMARKIGLIRISVKAKYFLRRG